MNRFTTRTLALAGLISFSLSEQLPASEPGLQQRNPPYPNIIFIFADDMGYGDVSGLNSFARTQTPAIDQLIGEGITFTEAHASASVCTPSPVRITYWFNSYSTILYQQDMIKIPVSAVKPLSTNYFYEAQAKLYKSFILL